MAPGGPGGPGTVIVDDPSGNRRNIEHIAFRGARTPVGCRPARQEPLLLIPLTSFLPCADLLVKKPQRGALCSHSPLPKHCYPLTWRQIAHRTGKLDLREEPS